MARCPLPQQQQQQQQQQVLVLLALLILSASIPRVASRDVQFRGEQYIVSSSPSLPPYRVPKLPSDPAEPRNLHLAFGATELDLTVTWSTLTRVTSPLASFRCLEPRPTPWRTVEGVSAKFVDGGPLRATQFVHRVSLTGLAPGQRCEYVIGNPGNSSQQPGYEFRVPGGGGGGRSLAVYGDLGLENAQSLPRLFDDAVTKRLYDAIVHVGDFAYDMPDDNGRVGDRFMQMLEPIASRLQYMTCVGNHEEKYNFSHYKARFSMPGWQENRQDMFYSVNIGLVHLISISNEFYFFTNYGTGQISRQYRWLEADLLAANRNRSAAPWIVLIGHRPMYCSNNESRDCDWGAETLRRGFRGRWWGLEPLMLRHGVDVAFWGHEHSFERTWPVASGQVALSGAPGGDPYLNPRAPVHVITGSAGNKEKHAYFASEQPKFSAFRSTDYGYTRVTFHNASHAFFEQVSDDREGEVIDRFTIVQTRHGPFVK